MTESRPPSGLKTPGKRLWVDVTAIYVLTPAELAVLRDACRTADECDRLERQVLTLPELVAPGSTGQPKAHPLLAEVRAHRQLLERLCTGLNLPDETSEIGLRGSSRHAQNAALSRWQRGGRRTVHGDVEAAAGG